MLKPVATLMCERKELTNIPVSDPFYVEVSTLDTNKLNLDIGDNAGETQPPRVASKSGPPRSTRCGGPSLRIRPKLLTEHPNVPAR